MNGIFFNCYYSGIIATSADTYATVFEGYNLLMNILFGLGYMYTDVVTIINLSATADSYWRKVGARIGDFIMRIFYRKIKVLSAVKTAK